MGSIELANKITKAAKVLRSRMSIAECTQLVSAALALRWSPDRLPLMLVPEAATWDRVVAASSPLYALEDALTALAAANADYFGRSFRPPLRERRVTPTEAQQLITILDEIPLNGEGDPWLDDLAGDAYERFLAEFADEKRGDVGTPRSVSHLMVRLAAPLPDQSVYDPCVGTGGLLTAADEYVTQHTGRRDALKLSAQDVNEESCTVASLNLMLQGITHFSVRHGDALTSPRYEGRSGGIKRFHRVLTHPPFGLRYAQEMLRIPQQTRYGSSPVADLMFVQHVLASLIPDGVGVMAVPNGVLFRGGAEGKIRGEMVEDQRIAAVIALGRNVFHGTSVPASILVLRGRGPEPADEHEVLFINAEHEVDVTRSRAHLAPRHVKNISDAFHGMKEISEFSRLVSLEEIRAKEYSLNVGDYVHTRSPYRATPSIDALLAGGVPAEEVAAQRHRFAAFGIDVNQLLVPGRPGFFDFPPQGYQAAVETIPTLATPTATAFANEAVDWFREFRQEQHLLTDRPIATAGEYFAQEFCDKLRRWALLRDEQVAGVFTDWWVTNHEDLNQLRNPALTPKERDTTLDRIGTDLAKRARSLLAQQLDQLVDLYRSWGEQYLVSLADLEDYRAAVSSRLATQLRKLGHPWPLPDIPNLDAPETRPRRPTQAITER